MSEKKYKVRVRPDMSYRVQTPKDEWPADNVGHLAQAGEELVITEAELLSFGDKFEVLGETKAALSARGDVEPEKDEEHD